MRNGCCTPTSTSQILGFAPFATEIERAFGPAFARSQTTPSPSAPMTIVETPEFVRVETDLPGFKMADLEITLVQRDLTIKGQRTWTAPEGSEIHRDERPTGEFARTLRLSVPIDPDRVTAALRDGVLTVTLPKVAAAQPRKIAVSGGTN